MSLPPPTSADAELVDFVRRALERAKVPQTPAALSKSLPNPYKKQVNAALLEEIAGSGRIFRFKAGKSFKYGCKPAEELILDAIVESATDEPRTWTELSKVKGLNAVKGLVAAKTLVALRESLIRSGRLYEWPKSGAKGSKERYCTKPIDAAGFLADSKAFRTAREKFLQELKKVASLLTRAGVSETEVFQQAFAVLAGTSAPPPAAARAVTTAAPAGDDLASLILSRMVEEDPGAAVGAPVSIRNLRRSLSFQIAGKVPFDEALLALADEGRVSLHRHDFPGGLTETERDEMVPDGRGGYYIAVSLRD